MENSPLPYPTISTQALPNSKAENLGDGAKLGRIPEHIVQGNFSSDHQSVIFSIRVHNHTFAPIDGGHDGTLKFQRHHDGHLHDGFKDGGLGFGEGLAESHDGGGTEGVLVGIDNVGATVEEDHAGAHNWMSDKGAL